MAEETTGEVEAEGKPRSGKKKLLLFGGMGLWAVLEMMMINAQDGPWQRPAPGPITGDLRLLAITLVLYGVIGGIHAWLGYWPFG